MVGSWIDPTACLSNGSHLTRSAHINASKFLRQRAGLSPLQSGNEDLVYGLRHAKLPQVRIHHLFLSGPIVDHWPTPTQREIMGGNEFDSNRVRENLGNFLRKAYRRPPPKAKSMPFTKFIRIASPKVRRIGKPTRIPFKAALCSPAFLYLGKTRESRGESIDSHSLASRLSYFLWSSMPDSDLHKLADQNRLGDSATLRSQVLRMLADPKSKRFVDGFLNAWLTLDNLGTTPDHHRFKEYYRR